MRNNRILALLIVFVLIFTSVINLTMITLAESSGNDYTGHWAEDAIKKAIAAGYMQGDGNNTFRPDASITRAEFAAMLWRAIDKPAVKGQNPFTDVKAGSWYEEPVRALYEAGITKGASTTLFDPDGALTREMGIVMLARAFGLKTDGKKTDLAFSDGANVSDWAREAVSAFFEAGLLLGNLNHAVEPKRTMKRAEMATLLIRVIGANAEGTEVKPVQPTTSSAITTTPTAITTTPTDTTTPTPTQKNVALRRAAWHSSAVNYDNTATLVTDGIINSTFDSSWVSKGNGQEWVYIDLGADSKLTSATVYWGENYATGYDIQTSSDAKSWSTVSNAAGKANSSVATNIAGKSGRYVRILCNASSGTNYIIKEIEVLGSNNFEYKLDPIPAPEADGTQKLTGGNWRLQRASEVSSNGATLSQAGYDDSSWLPASVPNTILVSYLKAGAIPDPNYDDWQNQISDSFFTADFWYRDSFTVSSTKKGQKVFLNFDAINWKADVYFNGHYLPNALSVKQQKSIEGAFIRGEFDVTNYVNYGGANYVAVYIYKNDTPQFGHLSTTGGAIKFSNTSNDGDIVMVSSQGLAEGPWNNGGQLGLDNPTFHAAIGWDWLPTIRGRDIGIYNDVYLSYSGGVELEDPWIETDLNITQTSSKTAAVNLAKGQLMTTTSAGSYYNLDPTTPAGSYYNILDENPKSGWVMGKNIGDSFTVDLGKATTVGSITIDWGEVPDTAAYETQNAKKFKLESSVDGVNWTSFDAFPGGNVNTGYWGMRYASPTTGTAVFTGYNVSNAIAGPTATVLMDFSAYGMGMYPVSVSAATAIRYIRFTTVELMNSVNSSHGLVPPKIQDIKVYAESTSIVGQSMVRTYDLDDSKANLTFRTEVKNSSMSSATAVVSGVITPGNIPFSKTIALPAGATQTVMIPNIVINNPELWWPNTYGDQFLYTADVQVSMNDAVADTKSFRFGVREFTYPTDGNLLTLYCNGTRIVAKGGNWGMDDGMKLDTAEDYDNKVRLTAEENLVMIRNWVGQTNNEAFYDACDKYGLLVWDDFWLANPADGPNPKDENMFVQNAIDKVKHNRYHAALTLYCGRNESNPPEPLNTNLANLTKDYDGTRIYFPNSAGAPVGSGGGYALRDPKQYYNDVPNVTLRSETGIPNVPDYESIKKFLPEADQWPISESWALHDFTFYMNGPANTYIAALKSYKDLDFVAVPNPGQTWGQNPALTAKDNPAFLAYKDSILKMVGDIGKELSLKEFSRIAQMINYENHRALFEGLTVKRSNGFLMWMSQSSFPSFMWQTYDYFLATNGGYFGVKAGNQPTHAVIDPRTNEIVLSNATTKTYTGVKTTFKLYDVNGHVVSTVPYTTDTLGPDAYGLILGKADFSASPTDVVFIKLTVQDSTGNVLGENLYWYNSKEYQNYKALDDLVSVDLAASVSTKTTLANGNDQYTITLTNSSSTPALQARLRTVSSATGEDVLPTFYGDNYICLMPGDSKTVTVEFNRKYLEGGTPSFELDGWNVTGKTIK
jgi:hypothetical protein